MKPLCTLLFAMVAVIVFYTCVVAVNHGLNLFPVFFGDIAKWNWPGQFDLDFICLLLLCGIGVAYRHRFSPIGILLGAGAFLLGTAFIAIYLLVEAYRGRGSVARLLVGANHADG